MSNGGDKTEHDIIDYQVIDVRHGTGWVKKIQRRGRKGWKIIGIIGEHSKGLHPAMIIMERVRL